MAASKMPFGVLTMIVGMICLAGCSGGGDNDSGGWGAYTPPEEVVPEADLEKRAADGVGQTTMIGAMLDMQNPLNIGYVIFGLSEPIAIAVNHWVDLNGGGNVASMSKGEAAKDSPATFILKFVKYARQKAAHKALVQTAQTTNLDWTDEKWNIRWTGTMV